MPSNTFVKHSLLANYAGFRWGYQQHLAYNLHYVKRAEMLI